MTYARTMIDTASQETATRFNYQWTPLASAAAAARPGSDNETHVGRYTSATAAAACAAENAEAKSKSA